MTRHTKRKLAISLADVNRATTPHEHKALLNQYTQYMNQRRENSLPSVSDSFVNNGKSSGLRILADTDIEPGTVRYLLERHFNVVPLTATRALHATKQEIFEHARPMQAVIVTHTRTYLDPNCFKIDESPGIIILPKLGGCGNPDNNPLLSAALDHLERHLPRKLEEIQGKIFHYSPDGNLRAYDCTPKPAVHPDHTPKLLTYFRTPRLEPKF